MTIPKNKLDPQTTWEDEFDEFSRRIFFEILGDTRYIVDVIDHHGVSEEELEKERLHDSLIDSYKQFIAQKKAEWERGARV